MDVSHRRRQLWLWMAVLGALYAEINDKIVRYTLSAGSIVPHTRAVPIVTGLPLVGAQLTSNQVSALAAYIWASSHR